jgi:hypothetical protein
MAASRLSSSVVCASKFQDFFLCVDFYLFPGLDIFLNRYHLQRCLKYSAENVVRIPNSSLELFIK